MRNQRTGKQIAGSGNVISGFIPKIRKAQKRSMRKNQQTGQKKKESGSSTGSKLIIACQSSVYRAGGSNPGIEFDLAKRAFVIRHVLMQDRRQRFSLLSTQ